MTNIDVSVPEEDLALRCEQATGPDRQLDFDIAAVSAACAPAQLLNASDYTASLDAAMSLVAGLGLLLTMTSAGRTRAIYGDDEAPAPVFSGTAATPALALCAAALRARVQGHSS